MCDCQLNHHTRRSNFLLRNKFFVIGTIEKLFRNKKNCSSNKFNQITYVDQFVRPVLAPKHKIRGGLLRQLCSVSRARLEQCPFKSRLRTHKYLGPRPARSVGAFGQLNPHPNGGAAAAGAHTLGPTAIPGEALERSGSSGSGTAAAVQETMGSWTASSFVLGLWGKSEKEKERFCGLGFFGGR